MEETATNKETLGFHEVEVKFRIDEKLVNDWKQIVIEYKDKNPDEFKEFIYVDSDDVYYTKKPKKGIAYDFVRYRYAESEKRAEITTKRKLADSNNINRKEYNIRVDGNSKEEIEGFFVDGLGYNYNFKITKFVNIYKFKDATLPCYTVTDENGKRDTFVEIEVDEKLLHKINEEEAWEIIKKYEEVLAPLGITPQKRLKKSLFEMYEKDLYSKNK